MEQELEFVRGIGFRVRSCSLVDRISNVATGTIGRAKGIEQP